jgi:hypothetical protein
VAGRIVRRGSARVIRLEAMYLLNVGGEVIPGLASCEVYVCKP